MPRIVVYAEGAGETAGDLVLPTAPGAPLSDDELGAAHILVARVAEQALRVPRGAIRFEGPLRHRGRVARGSDFLRRATLRPLLAWPSASKQPDYGVVIVDEDDDSGRLKALEAAVEGPLARVVVGVARQEFEAWLIADHATAAKRLGAVATTPRQPESMRPGEAKAVLATWCADQDALASRRIRRDLAEQLDLDVVDRACPRFAAFRARWTK